MTEETPEAATPSVSVPLFVAPAQSKDNVLVESKHCQIGEDGVPKLTSKQGLIVLNIVSPNAGFTIAFLCAVVILGIKTPLCVAVPEGLDTISNTAEASGLDVFIPTEPLLCA